MAIAKDSARNKVGVSGLVQEMDGLGFFRVYTVHSDVGLLGLCSFY